ncbi:MAG: hypothetical protein QOI99_826, partial [Actinomycetota bacterium]|nr:hypothetical protein [Actinomycetota bacterium]
LGLLATACGGDSGSTSAGPASTAGSTAPTSIATTAPTTPASTTPSTVGPTTTTTRPTSVPVVVDGVLKGSSEADRYTYDVTFPQVQGLAAAAAQDAVNAGIRAGVTAAVDEFVAGTKDLGPPPPELADPRSSLTGSYEVSRIDDGLASLRVHMSRYFAPQAHPAGLLLTFNYDLRTGKRLQLSDLFTAGSPYLDKLSELSRQLLAAQPDFDQLADFVQPGTEPKAENFAAWTLTDQDLVITFAEYQVAPYAMGTPHVSIPFASLRLLIDPSGPLAAYN